MPRIARGLTDGFVFHVLNRGNGKNDIFHKHGDYHAFIGVMAEAVEMFDVNFLAYCLMPNHFHLLLQPDRGIELSRMMQWLMTCHVRRYHQHYGTSGHVWQGRYKSFIVQEDEHLLTVIRYVEGNPVRSGLAKSANSWRWSSHQERLNNIGGKILSDLPVVLPANWTEYVDGAMGTCEVERLRKSVNRQAPYGRDEWIKALCGALGLESTVRERGRPKSVTEK